MKIKYQIILILFILLLISPQIKAQDVPDINELLQRIIELENRVLYLESLLGIGPQIDLCLEVTCNENQLTCDDGFVVTCGNTCDSNTGFCSDCSPDCAGHEDLCQGVICEETTLTCPDGTLLACSNTCELGVCSECFLECAGNEGSDKIVIFQLDDLQAWWLEEEATRLVNIHINKGIPVTLGVVPEDLHYREGDLTGLTENLKTWHNNNRDIVEIATHTYGHEDYSGWDLNMQIEDIKKGKKALNDLGIETTTFVPAYNWGNSNTPQAIVDSGFNIGLDALENPYIDSMNEPMILEEGVWYNYGLDSLDYKTVSNVIDSNMGEKGYYVIGYHQQDFSGASNGDFDKFADFLQEMKDSDKYTFMTSEQYYHHINS